MKIGAIPTNLSLDEKLEKVKKLKIAVCSIPSLGHFIPMSKIAESLMEAGHEVHFVTLGNYISNEKAPKILGPIGCKIVLTDGP